MLTCTAEAFTCKPNVLLLFITYASCIRKASLISAMRTDAAFCDGAYERQCSSAEAKQWVKKPSNRLNGCA